MHPNLITESMNAELDYRRERIARSFARGRHLRGGRRPQRRGHLDVVPPYGDVRA